MIIASICEDVCAPKFLGKFCDCDTIKFELESEENLLQGVYYNGDCKIPFPLENIGENLFEMSLACFPEFGCFDFQVYTESGELITVVEDDCEVNTFQIEKYINAKLL